MSQRPRLHMIGNAHLDIAWLWTRSEGFQEVKATFSSALDRIAEDDEFVFTAAGASYYKFVEENAPEMFERIRDAVVQGRWCIVGGWWLQPDCNTPDGESFVRHGLYGQRYFREKFGVQAEVGYNVDSFGHNGNLPQILKKSGLKYYVFMRPGAHEKDLPGCLFEWRSRDGSSVIAYRIPPNYNQSSPWGKDMVDKVGGVFRIAQEEGTDLMCFYGVGNHGGGPTKENIKNIKELRDSDTFDLVFSSPDIYFASLDEKVLPIVEDDLQFHAIGCYSAVEQVKRNNRAAENRLMAAEKFSSIAEKVLALPYPSQALKEAWETVLFNQFHDIMGGCSIPEVYQETFEMQGYALTAADTALNQALQRISWNVDTKGAEVPVVVFNPHPWPVKSAVEVNTASGKVIDTSGKDVPSQIIRSSSIGGRSNYCTTFVAELPPLGYKVYSLNDVNIRLPVASVLQMGGKRPENPLLLENDLVRITIDGETGCIKSYFDKENRMGIFSGQGGRPVVVDDPTDTWSHGVSGYHGPVHHFQMINIRVIEQGPVRTRVRTKFAFGSSTLNQDYILYRDSACLECRVFVNWNEKNRLLKMEFPVNVSSPRFFLDIPYGMIEKQSDGCERPVQKWADVTGQTGTNSVFGVAIISDSIYSCDALGSTIRMTCLRSPIYAHHDPAQPLEQEDYRYVDQGEHHFRYLVVPHAGHVGQSNVVRKAWEFNQPPLNIIESCHEGLLPAESSFLSVDRDSIVVTVLKRSEDGGDLIVRGYEAKGRGTSAELTIDMGAIRRKVFVEFDPFEIKTFKIPQSAKEEVIEVDFLERPLRE